MEYKQVAVELWFIVTTIGVLSLIFVWPYFIEITNCNSSKARRNQLKQKLMITLSTPAIVYLIPFYCDCG